MDIVFQLSQIWYANSVKVTERTSKNGKSQLASICQPKVQVPPPLKSSRFPDIPRSELTVVKPASLGGMSNQEKKFQKFQTTSKNPAIKSFTVPLRTGWSPHLCLPVYGTGKAPAGWEQTLFGEGKSPIQNKFCLLVPWYQHCEFPARAWESLGCLTPSSWCKTFLCRSSYLRHCWEGLSVFSHLAKAVQEAQVQGPKTAGAM